MSVDGTDDLKLTLSTPINHIIHSIFSKDCDINLISQNDLQKLGACIDERHMQLITDDGTSLCSLENIGPYLCIPASYFTPN